MPEEQTPEEALQRANQLQAEAFQAEFKQLLQKYKLNIRAVPFIDPKGMIDARIEFS